MTIIRIGIWLFWATVATVLTVIVLAFIADAWIADDNARQKSLIAKGYVLKMDNLRKRHKSLQECRIESDRMICDYVEKGEMKRLELRD